MIANNVEPWKPLYAGCDTVASVDQAATHSRGEAKLAFAFLWLFTFVGFGRPEDLFPAVGALHLTFLCSICALGAYVVPLVGGRVRLLLPRELILVLLLTTWFILGIPFAFYRTGSLMALIQIWVRTLLFFFLLIQTLTSVSRIRKILWAVLLSELMATSASILMQGKEASEAGERLAGVNQGLLGWNFLGITVAVTLPYVAFLYISRRSALRTSLLLVVLVLAMWMLVLTASRGGFLGIIFSMATTWWFVMRNSSRGRAAGFLLLMFFGVALMKAPDIFWLRMQTIWADSESTVNIASESAEESARGRQFLLERSIEYTLQNPVFGLGLGGFPVYNGNQLRRPDAWMGTHNTFTQLSSEGGIPALLLFLALFGTVLRRMKRASDELKNDPLISELRLLARATFASALAFAFGGFFAHLAYEFLFYYVVGISAAIWLIAQQSAEVSRSRIGSLDAVTVPPSQRCPEWRR